MTVPLCGVDLVLLDLCADLWALHVPVFERLLPAIIHYIDFHLEMYYNCTLYNGYSLCETHHTMLALLRSVSSCVDRFVDVSYCNHNFHNIFHFCYSPWFFNTMVKLCAREEEKFKIQKILDSCNIAAK